MEARQAPPKSMGVPDLTGDLKDYLLEAPIGKPLRVGSRWSSRIWHMVHGVFLAVVLILVAVGGARVLSLGWTPGYVALAALALGSALLLYPTMLGLLPRPENTRLWRYRDGVRFRPAQAKHAQPREPIPIERIRRLSLEGINHRTFWRADEDIVRAREEWRRSRASLVAKTQCFIDSGAHNTARYEQILADFEDFGPQSIGLVAELDDGSEHVLVYQSTVKPKEPLLALCAWLSEKCPQIERQLKVAPGDLVGDLPVGAQENGVTVMGVSWYAVAMLMSVTLSLYYWLSTLPRPLFGDPGTPSWLLQIYNLSPYLALIPLVLAMIIHLVAPRPFRGTVVMTPTNETESFTQMRRPLVVGGVIAALVGYLGFREVDFGVPDRLQLALGVAFVLCLVFRRIGAVVLAGMGYVLVGLEKVVKAAVTPPSEASGELRHSLHVASKRLAIGVGAVLAFLLVAGLGKLSDAMMSIGPGGGGGKSAIPLYVDLPVVSIALAIICWTIPRRGVAAMMMAMAIMTIFAWVVLDAGIPNLPLNPLATTYYMVFMALVGHVFLIGPLGRGLASSR